MQVYDRSPVVDCRSRRLPAGDPGPRCPV